MWLFFNVKRAIFQWYHGENKLHFNDMMYDVRFALVQHAGLDFNRASSLKQQSADRHVTPLGLKQIKQNKTKKEPTQSPTKKTQVLRTGKQFLLH